MDSLQAIAFNYLTAFALGTAFACVSGDFVVPTGVASWGTAVLLGATFVGAFVLMARSTALTGVTLTTVASRVSLVIPVVCSFLLFPEGDAPRWHLPMCESLCSTLLPELIQSDRCYHQLYKLHSVSLTKLKTS